MYMSTYIYIYIYTCTSSSARGGGRRVTTPRSVGLGERSAWVADKWGQR